MKGCIIWYIITSVSEDPAASIFRVGEYRRRAPSFHSLTFSTFGFLIYTADGGSRFLQNTSTNLANYTAPYSEDNNFRKV
jgi:hypothetical protein